MIDQTPGSCNEDLDAGAQITNLRMLLDTTVDDRIFDSTGSSEFVRLFFDLVGQLTSGSENEYDRAITRFQVRLQH